MMTTQELQALVELLNRCPMTAGERLWCQALIERLAKPEAAEDEHEDEREDEHEGMK